MNIFKVNISDEVYNTKVNKIISETNLFFLRL